MAYRFRIDRSTVHKQITTEEWENIEAARDGEQPRTRPARQMVARFMVDEEGQPVPYKQALAELAKIPLEEFWTEVFAAFTRTLTDTAVPNTSAGQSNSLSEANTPLPASLDGSQP